ncbi:Calcium-transporting ATPase [Bertholletia excelsa]
MELHEPSGFAITQESLTKLVETNDIQYLREEYGGILGVASALETNVDAGIPGNAGDLSRRHKSFGSNQNLDHPLQELPTKSLQQSTLGAFKDTTLILLFSCAALSVATNIKRNGPLESLLDGTITFLAIFVVKNFSFIVRFFKARVMKKRPRNDQNVVEVLRHGGMQQIAVSEVVVGDVLCLKAGDQVPADGLLIDGGALKLDDGLLDYGQHPSLFRGEKLVGGFCRMLVTSVGKNTETSRLVRSLNCLQSQEEKLLNAIDKTHSYLETISLFLSLILLALQAIRCFLFDSDCGGTYSPETDRVESTMKDIMSEASKVMRRQSQPANRLIAMLCILLFSLRDGLPLGIFVLLAFASKKLLSHRALSRRLPAGATIGLVTTICTSTTGDLALQPQRMAELWIGLNPINDVSREVALEVLEALHEGIGLSSCDREEFPIYFWARQVLGVRVEEFKQSCTILNTGEGERLCSLWVRRNGEGDRVAHVHWRGAPDVVLPLCTRYYHADGTVQTLNEHVRALLNEKLEGFACDSLRCVAFGYKQKLIQENEENAAESFGSIDLDGMTLLGMVCLKNPYPPELINSVKLCKDCGVKIKLVVDDDNINTARFIATNSGILEPDEAQMNNGTFVTLGPEFRDNSEEERMNTIENTSVITNCSPSNKLLVVQCLKRQGEVVAATGVSSRDFASLKEADIGLLLCDNEMARESCDIEVLDNNFVTISSMVKMGRKVFGNLRKFIQLHLTINISAFTINFIIVIFSGQVPVGPFGLLWVNMVMDVLGAMALSDSEVGHEHCPPMSDFSLGSSKPLISISMWKNIAAQSFYQVIVLLVLNFKGCVVLQEHNRKVLEAMIFNCFALCQVFVLINVRDMEKYNASLALQAKKYCPLVALAVAVVILHVAVTEILSATTHSERLNLKQWCICMGIAALSLPISSLAKWVSVRKVT